jgi:hypothetical protein
MKFPSPIFPFLILLIFFCSTKSNADIVSDAEERCGANLWEWGIKISQLNSYKAIITKYACTRGGKVIDGNYFNEYGEQEELIDGYNVSFTYAGKIINKKNRIIVSHIGNGNKLSVVDTPSGFPHTVFLVSRWGASNNYHSYLVYSTDPKLKRIAIIERPLNEFQANKKIGSERNVDGFYINDAGDFLIDILVAQPTNGSVSNADRRWNVETLKLNGDYLESVRTREFDVQTYERSN